MSLTFTYIKPTAVRNNKVGEILSLIEGAGYRIVAMKKTLFSEDLAKQFYAVHEGREFFDRLIKHSVSGPIVALLLEKEDAVMSFRRFIGSTNPEDAEKGTIRATYGESVTMNAIHGSDSDENALIESSFFFSNMERF